MQHSIQSTIEHIVSFDQDDATTLGDWLLEVFDHLEHGNNTGRELREKRGFDMACELADHLNGVN